MHKIGDGMINGKILSDLIIGMPFQYIPYMFSKYRDILNPDIHEVYEISSRHLNWFQKKVCYICQMCDMHRPWPGGEGSKYVSYLGFTYIM